MKRETRNSIKEELERKEKELELKRYVESESRRLDRYYNSNRVLNFLGGMAIGFLIIFFIGRFILPIGFVANSTGIQIEYLQLIKWAIIFSCGYYGMTTMGKFNTNTIEFITGFFK